MREASLLLVLVGGAFFHGLYYLLKAYLVRVLFTSLLRAPERCSDGVNASQNGGGHGNVVGLRSNGAVKNGSVSPSLKSINGKARVTSEVQASEAQVAEISKYIVSAVAGFITAGAAVIVLWQSKDDFLYGKSWFLAPYFHFLIWYFVYDMYAMFECVSLNRKLLHHPTTSGTVWYFLKRKGSLCFHHFAILLLCYPICVSYYLRGDMGDFFIGTLFLRDLSTPFFALTSILKLVDMQNTLLYKVTGLLFVVVFFIVRIITTPMCIVLYAAQYHHWNVWAALCSLRVYCHLGLVAEFSLQLFWFVKALRVVVQNARQVLAKRKQS